MKRSIAVFSAILLVSNVATAGTLKSLTEDKVNEALKGKTITTVPLVTIDGALVSNTFTGYLNTDGKVEGRMANKPVNGPLNDTGSWSVKSDGSLCITWDHWNNTKPICVAVYKMNNGLLLVNDDSQKLETIILSNDIQEGNKLS